MAYKSLLLDVDGVLVRDKLLMNHLNENCVKYVQSKMPDSKNAREINRLMYMTSGHTARGLHNNFGIDTSDFNEKVYDKKLIEHLSEVLSTFEFQEEAKYIHEWNKDYWKVTLFTNAPVVWAGTVARAISDEIYIRAGPENAMSGPLKPDAAAYADFPKTYTNIFVDDSLKNLAATRWMPNWHPVHFSQEPADPRTWCPTVSSLWELGLFLSSVEKSS